MRFWIVLTVIMLEIYCHSVTLTLVITVSFLHNIQSYNRQSYFYNLSVICSLDDENQNFQSSYNSHFLNCVAMSFSK